MSEFLEGLREALLKAEALRKEEEDVAARQANKWTPETIRAVAFKIAQSGSVVPFAREAVEALSAAANRIEKLSDSLKWSFIRSRQSRPGNNPEVP